MTPRGLWLRIAVGAFAALGAALLVPLPPPSSERAGSVAALVVGFCSGAALYVALARERPRRPGLTRAQLCFLLAWSVVEELLWRRLLLGGLALVLGAASALVFSSVLFALAHRPAWRPHLATGAVFGSAYLATGRLLAAVSSHMTYNLLAAGSPRRAPPRRA